MKEPFYVNDFIVVVPGLQFGTDFYIKARLVIHDFETPQSPLDYSCIQAFLFHDCGGGGEKVSLPKSLKMKMNDFVESVAMREAVAAAVRSARADGDPRPPPGAETKVD